MSQKYSQEWEQQRTVEFFKSTSNALSKIHAWIGEHWDETPAELRNLVAQCLQESNQAANPEYK